MLSTVGHAGLVLDLFSPERSEWGVTEAARELGLAKSQAHALMTSLAAIGLLQRVGRGRYRLGWRTVALATLSLRTSPFRADAARVMHDLTARTGETVELAVWERGWVVCIDHRQGTWPLPASFPAVGEPFPADGSAIGEVLVARSRDDLAVVRERGFASDAGGLAPGVCCVAAPVVDRRGEVVAALGIAVPASRWAGSRIRHTRAVVNAADEVSLRLRRR